MSSPNNNRPDDFWIFVLLAVLIYWGMTLEKKIDQVLTTLTQKETSHVPPAPPPLSQQEKPLQ